MLKNLKLAIILLPFAFPLYLIKLDIKVPFTLVELLIYICFLAFLIIKGRELIKIKISFKDFLKSIYFPIFLFVVFCTFSIFVMPDSIALLNGEIYESRRAALGIWKGWIISPILFFILVANVLKEAKDKFSALNMYSFSAVLLSLIAIFQKLTATVEIVDGRASGPFESANYLALYIVPALVYLGILIYNKVYVSGITFPAIKNIWQYLLAFITIFIGILLTQSYAGIIAVFGTFFIFAVYELIKFKNKKFLIIFGGIFIVLALVIVLTQIGTEKFESFLDFSERNSTTVRLEVWKSALVLASHNLFFGLGLGQFEPMYQLNSMWILGKLPYEWVMLHPHNIFLAFLTNTGILGLGSFLFILIRFFKNGFFTLCHSEQNEVESRNLVSKFDKLMSKELILIALFMMLSILLHGMFDTPFWKNDLSLLFFLVLGLVI